MATLLGVVVGEVLPAAMAVLAAAAAVIVLQPLQSRLDRFVARCVFGERLTSFDVLAQVSTTQGHAFDLHMLAHSWRPHCVAACDWTGCASASAQLRCAPHDAMLAEADQATIRIRGGSQPVDAVQIEIRDDGTGVTAGATNGGSGLIGMRDRVEAVGVAR